jgi:hypothetical protein
MANSRDDVASAECCGGGAPERGQQGPVSGMLAGTPTYVVEPIGGALIARPLVGAVQRRASNGARNEAPTPVAGMLAGTRAYDVPSLCAPNPLVPRVGVGGRTTDFIRRPSVPYPPTMRGFQMLV